MKRAVIIFSAILTIGLCGAWAAAQDVSAVRTVPRHDSRNVHRSVKNIVIEFSAPVRCDSIIVSATEFGTLPAPAGAPYLDDARTLVLPVMLASGTRYSIGINTGTIKPFRYRFDTGIAVRPYILTFTTSELPVTPELPRHQGPATRPQP